MQYSIHKRRKLRTGKRQKALLPSPIVERTHSGARQPRREHAPAIARPDPDHVITPPPPIDVAPPEPAFADRRELVRLIHETQSFEVGLQRTITEQPPPAPDKVATGSVVAKRPLPPDGD